MGLNNIDVCACDFGNAYLNAPCREKLWTEAESEFGSEKRYVFLIVRDFYEPNLSGEARRDKLEETLN